jgi:energy-converting hydrogenase Eha subunit E
MPSITTSNLNGTTSVVTCDRCNLANNPVTATIDLGSIGRGLLYLCADDLAQLLTFIVGATVTAAPGVSPVPAINPSRVA